MPSTKLFIRASDREDNESASSRKHSHSHHQHHSRHSHHHNHKVLYKIASEPRLLPITVSGLAPGSKFRGLQKSGRNQYEVNVDLLSVDLANSELCGYLKIKGLTEEFPELITFFEAEIIGDKHSFLTRKWDADESIDLQHWTKFPSFASKITPSTTQLSTVKHDPLTSRYVYMRWKESFLVPHWRVKSISGASFAGFYYVCFDRSTMSFDGFYYHRNSEWYQNLKLNMMHERASGAFEFR